MKRERQGDDADHHWRNDQQKVLPLLRSGSKYRGQDEARRYEGQRAEGEQRSGKMRNAAGTRYLDVGLTGFVLG